MPNQIEQEDDADLEPEPIIEDYQVTNSNVRPQETKYTENLQNDKDLLFSTEIDASLGSRD